VRSGDTFALQLRLRTAQALNSIPLTLGFDPQVLQVVRVEEGDFLRQGGAATAFASRVDARGQIAINATRSAAPGGSGAATFATVHFRAAGQPGASANVQVLTATPALDGQLMPVALPLPFGLAIVP
jgi:general secretion pathway protein D